MTTKYQPLITRKDIEAIHRGNQLNRQVLQAGIRELVKDVHDGNEQSSRVIKGVRQING
ncbi:hypothetical protein T1J70_02355 [Lactiplantibacillus plantarum]|uniref:hypothetical protein n=1 Tax=Lactiplantibacillus plantarum TaxID=1590 RepID=UPI001CFE19D1|nr:hypothetical protein [Lactiplantibacillus plantarum]WQC49593.1 hypothetical protein TUW04_11105 [Lactiplantibacillus plantarum]WQG55452.1 hypothetical protein T1J70_02355 [Lactiplantibacillus plantarum]GJI54472.1 hypothetical protein NMZ1139_27000 [Lactiplantibacillus plantarum]